ncbi:NADH-quinone oxidoreductase subunit J [Candidatus Erwinia haradaeae]|uniref:NADH-quinone oxidoreductase subunit J n=1 Tax=Candidatus Erwinia haradaeae TaxID=1922217 RepID=A0A451DJY8_9GAMM|nr:NADH-quinone oxidoreductase subunit J [Candidatus Erwinia haradaeae]VFP87034.1 NADH-quinone oxidoreductase subunit J [Candidatus Erwinia haradaeae]
MECLFYICGLTAVLTTMRVIWHKKPIHALLHLIISFVAVSGVLFSVGAYFTAALEIIIYAGAIVVLFMFSVMMLNLSDSIIREETTWLPPRVWIGPGFLSFLLFLIISYSILLRNTSDMCCIMIDGKQVGIKLFGPYALSVELISMLLLSGLIVGCHIGQDSRQTGVILQKKRLSTSHKNTFKNQLEK